MLHVNSVVSMKRHELVPLFIFVTKQHAIALREEFAINMEVHKFYMGK